MTSVHMGNRTCKICRRRIGSLDQPACRRVMERYAPTTEGAASSGYKYFPPDHREHGGDYCVDCVGPLGHFMNAPPAVRDRHIIRSIN